jgi:hypothetical protein
VDAKSRPGRAAWAAWIGCADVSAVVPAVGLSSGPPRTADILTATASGVSDPNGNAITSPALLWPSNNKFVTVTLGGVTDADGDGLTLTITGIYQDEPVGKGNSAPDGKGIGTATAELRAEKLGNGDGRVYHVSFTASDGHGGACTGLVRVTVPHDQAKPARDGGPLFDSTLPTP